MLCNPKLSKVPDKLWKQFIASSDKKQPLIQWFGRIRRNKHDKISPSLLKWEYLSVLLPWNIFDVDVILTSHKMFFFGYCQEAMLCFEITNYILASIMIKHDFCRACFNPKTLIMFLSFYFQPFPQILSLKVLDLSWKAKWPIWPVQFVTSSQPTVFKYTW